MAKKSSKSTKSNGNKPATNISDYDSWKSYHGFGHTLEREEEFNLIKKVRKAFEASRRARLTTCYWTQNYDDTDSVSTTGGNWEFQWTKQEKMYLRWAKASSTDSFESNIKSPMSTGRIESTHHKIKKLNMEYDAKPNSDDDIGKAKIAELVLKNIISRSDIDKEYSLIYKDSLMHGIGFAQVEFTEIIREHTYKETESSKLDDKQKEDLQKKRKPVYKKPVKEVVFSDITVTHIPIRELYVDPSAKQIHGIRDAARWVIRRRFISMDDFHMLYDDNPEAVNIDKVKPTSSYVVSNQYSFFVPPGDMTNQESIELLEYENQVTDEYLVVANDLLIISKPLPYDHKEISYHEFPCILFPGQFYHIGIPDLLMGDQVGEEILVNMVLDKIYQSMTNQFLIDKQSYGEVTQAMIRARSQFIPIDTAGGQGGVGGRVMPIPYNPVGFDVFKTFEVLTRYATEATQIDASQTSVIPSNAPATFGIMAKELAENMVAGIVDNFSNYGLTTSGRQVWANVQQFYTEPLLKRIDGTDNDVQKYRRIRLDGMKVVIDKSDIQIKEDKDKYNFLELKPKLLDTRNELEISISPDSLEIISKGLEMQKMQQFFAQAIPFSVDPNNPLSVQNTKLALFNGPKLAEIYARVNNISEDVLLSPATNKNTEIIEAYTETQDILDGKFVAGRAGRTPVHIDIHDQAMFGLQSQLDQYHQMAQEEMQKQLQEQPMQIDPMTGQPAPQQPPQISEDITNNITRINQTMDTLNKHIMEDSATALSETQLAGSMAGAANQPPAPQQAPMPPGGSAPQVPTQDGQAPMPPGGMMGGPMSGSMGAMGQ